MSYFKITGIKVSPLLSLPATLLISLLLHPVEVTQEEDVTKSRDLTLMTLGMRNKAYL